jgi:hypothetical protein
VISYFLFLIFYFLCVLCGKSTYKKAGRGIYLPAFFFLRVVVPTAKEAGG